MIIDSDPLAAMRLPELRPGAAWLVGAGPGDPGLLTIHAVNALRQADVVLYDALVSDRVLALARPGARLEETGKRGYEASMPQADITNRIIQLAREGLRVVRLKGGDPFVFGRGSEEASALVDEGIPVSIVPGITSGIAALTAAAIPLTARETNSAVTLATGHFSDGDSNRVDWENLARLKQPIVLYMAVRQIGVIVNRLMSGGLSPETPVTFVSEATTPAQRVVDSMLGRAEGDASAADVSAPAIIAIGANVALRRSLAAGLVPLVPCRNGHGISDG